MTCEEIDARLEITGLKEKYWYCISSAQLGLGGCQCNSHPWFGRHDGADLDDDSIAEFVFAVFGDWPNWQDYGE